MKKKTKNLILSIVVTLILLLTFTVTYAVFTYQQTGENNQQLVLGDIYMHYNETTTTIDIDNMMPIKKESYEVEITDERVELCKDYIYDTYGTKLGDYGIPMSNMVDSGKVKFMAIDDEYTNTHEYLCKNNLLQEINNGLFTQKDINYFIEIGLIKNVIDNIKSLDYFEFTISGKNTNTKGDISYSIQLAEGEEPVQEGELILNRIEPSFLRFRLTEVNGSEETILKDNQVFTSFENANLYTSIISNNTTNKISKTYRLYMWIDENVVIGNTSDADYSMEDWANLYASIKVQVNGKYVKTEPEPLSEKIKSKLGSEGVVAVNTDGDLYDGTGEIREYRYSGLGNYCTYTDGANDYKLNVEDNTCPQTACSLIGMFVINGNSEGILLEGGGSCTSMGGVEFSLKDNQTTPTDSGLRNYVEFNGELWRIIGVFGDNVKIVKDTPLANDIYNEETYTSGETTYNLKFTTEGTKYGYFIYKQLSDNSYNNDWTTSGVMHYLNDETGNSYYVNNLSNEAKNMIQETTYYLGNVSRGMMSGKDVYEQERGNVVCDSSVTSNSDQNGCNIWNGNQENWTGNIALIYPSDFMYSMPSNNWASEDDMTLLTAFRESWLRNSEALGYWLLSPSALYPPYVCNWSIIGEVGGSNADDSYALRPSLNLKSNIMVTSGDGSYDNPYRLIGA
ncbi:MAG: hypothetical protein IJ501_06445 [Bacilli bacterium]|nr:hypothetical protein [Bacilli bacterium]